MGRAGAALLAVALLGPAAGRAETLGQPRVGKPGVYVVSSAGDLRAGDRLAVLVDGRLAPRAITEIATRAGDVDVFDLTIASTHAYFAGGVLAHNY